MSSFSFEYPWLLGLIIVFLIANRYFKMRSSSLIFPHLNLFTKTSSKSKLVELLKWIAILSMIIALASPVKKVEYLPKKSDGYAMALLIDSSGSMRVRDRFIVVKDVVEDFIKRRENDNVGLIVFGSEALVASPLTFDHKVLADILRRLHVGVVGEKTAIFDSMLQGVKLLKRSSAKSKIMILLTDGRNTAGSTPINVAKRMVKKYDIKFYAVGIGDATTLDEKVLKSIANDTDGKYFRASSVNQLASIYDEINKLEKSKIERESFVYKNYYFMYPLFLAILALSGYLFLRNKRGV